jgi:hypothetical protein
MGRTRGKPILPIYPDAKLIARFWERVDKKRVNDCWLWTGSVNGDGVYTGRYGVISFHGRTVLAHRLSYEIANGPGPILAHPDWQVGHICRDFDLDLLFDNRLCVNPRHLVLTDAGSDASRKRNRRHQLGLVKAGKRASPDLVLAVLEAHYIQLQPLKLIYSQMGVNTQTLWNWVTGRVYTDILEAFMTANGMSPDDLARIRRSLKAS